MGAKARFGLLSGLLVAAFSFAWTPVAGQTPDARPSMVRIPFPQDDGTLTPYTFDIGYPLVTLIYDTLFWRDPEAVPRPWLARSAETSVGGMQVTIKLAEGARWHDGTPVTARDVAFTYAYFASRPHPRFSPQLRAVRSIETPDRETLVIHLRWPSPGFLDQPLAEVPILPRHLWQNLPAGKPTPDGLPVGSGPYRLVEHRTGERYRFEANTDYFRGSPSIRTIEVPIIGTTENRIRAFERKEVDIVSANYPKRVADRVRLPGARVVEGVSFNGTVLMFNLRRPPFDRVEARQAVAKALDIRRITRIAGRAVVADRGYLHPDSAWASKAKLHVFDERAARELLAGLKLPPLQILAPGNDLVQIEAAEQVALALLRAGVAAEAKTISENELSKAVGEDGSQPSFQAAIWRAPSLASYDPQFLTTLFASDPSIAPMNYAGYASKTFDGLARRIVSASASEARRAAVLEALRLLSTDLPVVPLFYMNGVYAYRPTTHDGWVFVKGSGVIDKRSFTDPKAPVPGGSGATDTAGTDKGGRLPGLKIVALGALALAAILATTDILRRIRS